MKAAKHLFLKGAPQKTGTVIEVMMTQSTGLSITFIYASASSTEQTYVDWGDGSTSSMAYTSSNTSISHTYGHTGYYKITFYNVSTLVFRTSSAGSAYSYDAAILSFVDYSKTITGINSGAYRGCVNLQKYIAPNAQNCGEKSFADCTNLKEVEIGKSSIHYDKTYQNCSKLVNFKAESVGTCWHYVWQGCSSLQELHIEDNWSYLKFGNSVFSNCTKLADIYIPYKTVSQIRYNLANNGYSFPWGASNTCKFHGSDGTVLGNGTII